MKLTSATLSRHADKSREIELRKDGKTYQRNDKKIADWFGDSLSSLFSLVSYIRFKIESRLRMRTNQISLAGI